MDSLSRRPVRIIRLVARDTVEEVILKHAQRKLRLSTAVVDENDANINPVEKLSLESVSAPFELETITTRCLFHGLFLRIPRLKLTAIVQYGVSRLFKQPGTSAPDVDAGAATSSVAARRDLNAEVENVQGASGHEALDMDALIGPTRDGEWLKQQKRVEPTSVGYCLFVCFLLFIPVHTVH